MSSPAASPASPNPNRPKRRLSFADELPGGNLTETHDVTDLHYSDQRDVHGQKTVEGGGSAGVDKKSSCCQLL